MKKLLIICIVALYVAALANRVSAQGSSAGSPVPFITGITPRAAPSGAVIQLNIQSNIDGPDTLLKYRLAIGGVTARFYLIDKDNKDTVAAVVPFNIKMENMPPPGSSIPVEILFFDNNERGGIVYNQFRVLIPTSLPGKDVEISGITELKDGYVDVTFNDDIPVELWGRVRIYFDDKPAEKIVKMDERLFTVQLPSGVLSSAFSVFAKVGDNETSVFKYDRYVKFQNPTPTLSPQLAPQTTNANGTSTLTLFSLAAGLVGMLLAFYFYRQSKRSSQIVTSIGPPAIVEELHLPEELPPDLVDACAAGECVLYAGAGLSAQSGLPNWKEFVLGLLEWARENNFINDVELVSYLADVHRGQADPVADSVVSKLVSEDAQSALNSYLQKVFLKRTSPSAFHSQLKRIKLSAVLTTNFDNLLEGVYDVKNDQIYTPKDTEALLAALTRRSFFILKLYGTLDRKDTVMVAPAQYEEEIRSNSLFPRFMQTLFLSRTILFVGASMEGIETYLKGIAFPRDLTRRHYALVGVKDNAWRAKADLLERRYGIKVLPYTPTEGYAELGDFLSKLANTVTARTPEDIDIKRETSRLKRITLANIGPFDSLELELDLKPEHKWHVFLGDNGVGKSTVLKAIAFALCGEKAQPYASRLLKGGKSVGKITLETDNGTSYVTILERKDKDEVVIVGSDKQALPLEAEGWLAVGFPPLRTTSWEPPKGPDAEFKIKSRPGVDDLLPLVKGDVDPRLDKLKQWIVNLDYQDAKSKNREGHPYKGLIQKVFDILGSVAEGMKLNYKGVGEGNRILIETDDGGSIPLEGLSQGTISLMGWIGILMQRLYEVFDQDEDPTKRYALILMDEIDAHMHPLWQRTLVTHLKETFPNAQFIATTHSPLVVGGMLAKQVVRFARDKKGNAIILPIAPDMTFGYTDQVLTSMLFGLPTSLDRPTEKKMERFYQLEKMKDRGDNQKEYEELKQELIARVPPRTGSYEEKHAEQMEEADMLTLLGDKLNKRSPDSGQILLGRAKKLREMIGGVQSNDQS